MGRHLEAGLKDGLDDPQALATVHEQDSVLAAIADVGERQILGSSVQGDHGAHRDFGPRAGHGLFVGL
jgi:hypothetical protein